MAQNNLQIENLHAFLVRSYIQHMNESSSFINESLNTIRRQDSAYNRMINDTFRLLNAEREQSTVANDRIYNVNRNDYSANLNSRSRRSFTIHEPNLLTRTEPYRDQYSSTATRNASGNFYNNMRNFWSHVNNPSYSGLTNNLDINAFEDVVIAPTSDEISNATHIIRYGNITQPQNQTCPISLSTFQDDTEVMRIRYCGHLFNSEDLQTWFQQNVRCPLCRYDIRNYNHNLQTPYENTRIVSNTTNRTREESNISINEERLDHNESLHESQHLHDDSSTDDNVQEESSEIRVSNQNENRTNIIQDRNGSLVYTRNIISTNIDDLQNQLQSLFNDINSSLLYSNMSTFTNTVSDSSNNLTNNLGNNIQND